MNTNKDILIGKYLSGNASEEEKQQLFDWLKENPANEKELKAAEKIWKGSEGLKLTKQYNAEEAWEDFKERAKAKPKSDPKLFWLRAAASFIFFALAIVVIRLVLPAGEQQKLALKPAVIEAPVKTNAAAPIQKEEQKDTVPATITVKKSAPQLHRISTADSAIVFLLPDSSKVYLNRNSSLSFSNAFGKKERRIELSGEAFFEVRHLSTPFLVACGKTIVHDIGTSFNVKGSAKDSVEVSVITGSVEFYASNSKTTSAMILKEGNCGVYHPQSASFEKTKNKKGLKWWKSKNIKNRIREFFDKLKGKKH